MLDINHLGEGGRERKRLRDRKGGEKKTAGKNLEAEKS